MSPETNTIIDDSLYLRSRKRTETNQGAAGVFPPKSDRYENQLFFPKPSFYRAPAASGSNWHEPADRRLRASHRDVEIDRINNVAKEQMKKAASWLMVELGMTG